MNEPRTLGPWLRRFLAEYVVTERNLARNTQLSYRDTFVLLIPFVSAKVRKPADRLALDDLSSRRVLEFLAHLEDERGCSAQTRNLLLFLHNTGARVSEATALMVRDLELGGRGDRHALVTLHGKGRKRRQCPLWPRTEGVLAELVKGRSANDAVFLSRYHRPYTRFGVYRLVERCAARVPALEGRTVTPHQIRHSSACHLLQSEIDINTIRAWLGHVSLDTTNIYAEIDIEMKARAMALCDAAEPGPDRHWKEDAGLAFLDAL